MVSQLPLKQPMKVQIFPPGLLSDDIFLSWSFIAGIAWSKRCGLGPRKDSVRLTDTRLSFLSVFNIPWGSRWWLGLPVNQSAAGSIPAYGAVAVLYWFQELDCESGSCRFDSDRSP